MLRKSFRTRRAYALPSRRGCARPSSEEEGQAGIKIDPLRLYAVQVFPERDLNRQARDDLRSDLDDHARRVVEHAPSRARIELAGRVDLVPQRVPEIQLHDGVESGGEL